MIAKCGLLLLALTAGSAIAQSSSLRPIAAGKGYVYEQFTFPSDILVFRMDKSKLNLEVKGLTLLQVWTLKNGTEPELWTRIEDIAATYKSQGLTTLSVNFENGSGFKRQHAQLLEYFKKIPQPENFFFDPLGYVPDLLQVPGFPTYYLIDDGEVVFYTLGEDAEGVGVLESEIRARLASGFRKLP